MLTSIRRYLTPPIFEDEEKTRAASLLNTILLSLAFLMILIFIGIWLGGQFRLPVYLFIGIFFLVILGLQIPMRRGHVRLTSVILVLLFPPLVTGALVSSGTVRAPGAVFYIFAAIIAGLLVSRRMAFWLSIANVVVFFGALWAEINGQLPPPTEISITQGIVFAVGSIFTIILLNLALQNIDNALERARQNEREVRDLASTLEQHVEERSRSLSEALQIAHLGNWEYDFLKDEFTFTDDFYAMMRTSAEREGGYTMNAARYTERFVYSEDAPLVGIEIGKAIETDDPNFSAEVDHRVVFGDGSIGFVTVRFRIEKDTEGRTVKSYGANQDITESKKAEQELRKFRLALERSTDAVFMTDPNGIIEYVNPAFEKTYGFPAEEAVGKNPRIIKSGLIPQDQYKFFWQALLNNEIVAGELINKRKDGQLIPIDGMNASILDENGTLLGFMATHRDITTRKQAEETLEKRAAELETVAEVSAAVTTIQDVEVLLQQVVDLTKESFQLYHAHVYLLNEAGDSLVLRAGAGEPGRIMTAQERTIPLDHQSSLVARAGRTRQTVVVNDVSQAPDFLPNPLLPDTKSEMAVPLLIGEQVLGVLDVQSDQLAYFTDEDQRIQSVLAGQVAIAISNAAQYTREQAQAQRLTSLVENTADFTNPQMGMDTLMSVIIQNAVQLLEADDAGLWLSISEDEIELKCNRHNDHLIGTRLKNGEGLSGRAFEAGKVFRVDDYATWSGRALTETSIRVAMAVPLIWQEKPIGVLALTRENTGRVFTEEDERMTQLFISQAASAIENVRAFERTQQTLKELDILTRRLTREGWKEYLAEAERDRIGFVYEGDRLVPSQENGRTKQDEGKNFVQPIVLRGERIGQLVASDPEFEDEELQTILAAVSQGLSAHLENLRLTEEAERRVNELDIINDIGQALATEVDLHRIIETVLEKLRLVFKANVVYTALYDSNRQTIHIPFMIDHGKVILDEPPFPFGEGVNSTIIKTRQRIFINQDSERHLRELGALPTVSAEEKAKSFIGVPLISGEDVIGVLGILDTEREGRFTQGDVELVTTIAANVAVALQKARLFTETQKRAEREAMVNLIGQKIQSATTVQGALQTAIQELGVALKARKTIVELATKSASDGE